jgi:Mce-associated membrane protein
VEDQQSAPGDLTDPGAETAEDAPVDTARRRHRMPVGKARRVATPVAVDPSDGGAPDTAEDADAPEVPDALEVPDREPAAGQVVFVERKRAGPGAKTAVGVAAVLFVGAGAFAGAMAQPYYADRAQVDTKVAIATTAAEAITTLFTYTPDNMESLADRSAAFLGGDFEAQYRKYIDAIAPSNKQAQVSNTTQVVGAAVESLNGPDATALVYTNTTSMSPLSKNIPAMQYLSYRLTLKKQDAKWLVTKMSTITSLDLTPRM